MRMASKRLAAGMCLAALAVAPALAQTALPKPVEETALVRDAFSTGALTRGEGALPPDLWRGANSGRLNVLLALAPARLAGPTLGDVLRRVLLSPGDAPEGAGPSLGGRKLLALARAGFIDEARTIASLSSAPRNDPWVGQALAIADLLSGDVNAACTRNAALASGRDADFWMKLRLICYAAAGERDAADLTLTLLREKGALAGADETLLTAIATGASPKTAVAPRNALQLAAVRQIGLPLAPGLLAEAQAGVLKAVARDARFDAATRITAANGAAAMGVATRGDLAAFYESLEIEVADLAHAGEIIRTRPHDPITDVIAFQAVRQMTAPEFLRDKAARIAEALGAADSFPRTIALSLLYADEIEALEGALLTPREAAAFAAARMAIGDGDGAARWLFAMLGSGGAANLTEDETMEMIELINFLSVLDPISAAAVAEAAGVSIVDPRERLTPPAGDNLREPSRMTIVESAFDAAIADIPGQAGLAALAMSGASAFGDPVAEVVIDQSLRAAGLNELRRRVEFEAAWRARYASLEQATSEAAADAPPAPAAPPADGEDGLAPRLKPRGSG